MAHPTKDAEPRLNLWAASLTNLKLARWEARQTGRLLLLTALGIVLAVVLLCVIPLYAQVAISSGIRDTISSSAEGPYITVSAVSSQLATRPIGETQQQITRRMRANMGTFVGATPQFSIQLTDLSVLSSPRFYPSSQINLYGQSMQSAASHLKLLQGRLPRATGSENDIEIAVLPITAKAINATIGSTLSAQVFGTSEMPQGQATVTLRIVGIFALPAHADPYWHGQDFHIAEAKRACGICPPPPLFQALTSNNTLMSTFGPLATSSSSYFGDQSAYLSTPLLFWYFPLSASRINILTLNPVVNGMKATFDNLSNTLSNAPYVADIETTGPYTPLQLYNNYIFVLLISAIGLTALLLGIMLYFVSVMMQLLVERRSASIATLRSRGANRRQIMSLFAAQASGLALAALIVGPLLALLAVRLLVQSTLPPSEQGALDLLTSQPLTIAAQLLVYALVAVSIALITMLIALYQATRTDVMTLRRESARDTRVPFWQRVKLDLIAACAALAGYAAALYIASPGVLGARARVVALAPITLFGVVFLLIAATLLFLRGFPLLLRLASRLALRGKSAAPMLALAQMARAPRSFVRTIMLLAFATAFIVFALVFSATQTQRMQDVAAYQVGADLSGSIANHAALVPSSAYSGLPGIAAASTGYTVSDNVAGLNGVFVDVMAVDANTFARTAAWANQDSTQSPAALMAQLAAARSSARTYVPAIVDAAAASNLRLSIGSHFTLSDSNGQLGFVVVAEAQHIPTLIDTTAPNDTGDPLPSGGILVDFQTYANLEALQNGISITTTSVWIRTNSGAQALAAARRVLLQGTAADATASERQTIAAALQQGAIPVDSLSDRRAIAATLQSDPLYHALLELLFTGTLAALLLALIGSLVASWQNARRRLLSFSVLRALGGSRAQLASVLLWEQCIVYATALLLGLCFGVLLSLLALPTLVFTSVGSGAEISSGQFYVIQGVPPVQVALPATLWLALAALILVCIVAIVLMVRVVTRPSISQTLRLSED